MVNLPHQAGTFYDKTSADFIHSKFKFYGFEVVNLIDYDVYLDFADEEKINK